MINLSDNQKEFQELIPEMSRIIPDEIPTVEKQIAYDFGREIAAHRLAENHSFDFGDNAEE